MKKRIEWMQSGLFRKFAWKVVQESTDLSKFQLLTGWAQL